MNHITNRLLSQEELRLLHKTKPLIHFGSIIINWLVILGAIWISWSLSSLSVYLLSILVIGARMHGLAVLMHDASHYRFLKNKKISDLLTDLFIMYPLFSSVSKYRNNHLAHHKHLNTDMDPDWVAKIGVKSFRFPKSQKEFVTILLSYFLLYKGVLDLIWFTKRLRKVKRSGNVLQQSLLPMFYFSILVSLITYTGFWSQFVLYWIVPYLSTFLMFQYIRSVAEHFGGLQGSNELNSSRTVIPTFLEKIFISPHNINYHLEHHLYPGVPFYNLPKLHNLLSANNDYSLNAHVTTGYLSGLFKELSQNSKAV